MVQAIQMIRINLNDPKRVEKWSEAIEALVDLAFPWIGKDKTFLAAWKVRPLRVFHHNGNKIPFPQASDCRAAQEILFAALAGNGLLIHMDKISGPGVEKKDEEGEGSEEEEELEAEA